MNKPEAPQSSDYFGTFLETVQQSAAIGESTSAVPFKVLEVLDDRGPQEVRALQVSLGLDLVTFSRTLESLIASNLVTVSGEAGNEVVSLTDEGKTLARMQAATTAASEEQAAAVAAAAATSPATRA